MEKNNPYTNYTQLLEKVDEMFRRVQSRHQDKFSCRKGCHGCCAAGLTVSNVEVRWIERWLSDNPSRLQKILDGEKMLRHPHFCELLDEEGQCSIYEVRPLICRSHGMPISWKDEEASADPESRDVCPLNFTGVDLNSLDQSDVISIDHVNVLLSLINRAFDEKLANERYALSEIPNRMS